jgi:hypothetical protein
MRQLQMRAHMTGIRRGLPPMFGFRDVFAIPFQTERQAFAELEGCLAAAGLCRLPIPGQRRRDIARHAQAEQRALAEQEQRTGDAGSRRNAKMADCRGWVARHTDASIQAHARAKIRGHLTLRRRFQPQSRGGGLVLGHAATEKMTTGQQFPRRRVFPRRRALQPIHRPRVVARGAGAEVMQTPQPVLRQHHVLSSGQREQPRRFLIVARQARAMMQ